MAWSWNAEGNDGFNDVRNIQKVDEHRHGILFYPMKALLVSKGWTVEGSGDGASKHEFRGTTAGGGIGSGGAYDVWAADTGANDGSAGNVSNALTWCVLKAPTGTMEILLVGTSRTVAGWDAYGYILFSHSDGYTATGVAPTTPPAAPTDEQSIFSQTRPFGTGNQLVSFSGDQYVHLGANSTAVNGVYGFWYATVSTAGTRFEMMQLTPITSARSWDVAPYAFLRSATGKIINTWEKKGLTGERYVTSPTGWNSLHFDRNFWNNLGNDDPETGSIPMGEIQIIGMLSQANQEHFRGTISDIRVIAAATDGAGKSAEYPNLTERDPDGLTWLHWDDQAIPWDDSSSPPIPLGGSGGVTSIDWITVKEMARSETITYRGLSGGIYVYAVGAPPVGATDVVIVGE